MGSFSNRQRGISEDDCGAKSAHSALSPTHWRWSSGSSEGVESHYLEVVGIADNDQFITAEVCQDFGVKFGEIWCDCSGFLFLLIIITTASSCFFYLLPWGLTLKFVIFYIIRRGWSFACVYFSSPCSIGKELVNHVLFTACLCYEFAFFLFLFFHHLLACSWNCYSWFI